MHQYRNHCTLEGCPNLAFGHGYCNMHYKRWRKTGDPGAVTSRFRGPACSVAECPQPHSALGFCDTHYTRFKATGVVPTTPIRVVGPKPVCSRPLCTRVSAGLQVLCSRHYSLQALWRTYDPSFSWSEYDRLWEEQGAACAVCRGDLEWDAKTTHVDHDHQTGKIRGLLCSTCNQGLGSFRDDPALLSAALVYLGY